MGNPSLFVVLSFFCRRKVGSSLHAKGGHQVGGFSQLVLEVLWEQRVSRLCVCVLRHMLMHIFRELLILFCLISILAVHKQGTSSCSHKEGARVKWNWEASGIGLVKQHLREIMIPAHESKRIAVLEKKTTQLFADQLLGSGRLSPSLPFEWYLGLSYLFSFLPSAVFFLLFLI